MATIDLVRHAEPDITIHDDFLRPLTSAGQRQTQQLVDSLHQYPYTAFFSSHSNVPLIRSHRLQMI
ncbi:hypothetical protein Lpp125_10721, partial [Lacticaseibacillus paracasei subsp. paracasei Lpp125]